MPGKRLAPEAMTEIAGAALALPPDANLLAEAAALAARLGINPAGVEWNLRRMRKRGGWYTPLLLVPCVECGLTLAGPPGASSHRTCTSRVAPARRRRERRASGETPPGASTPYVRRWRQARPDAAAVLREREKAVAREQYHALPGSAQAAIVEKAHEHDRTAYPITLDAAWRRGDDWTEDEDRYVLEHPKMPARDVGLHLGRTLWAVRSRRVLLRRRPARQEDRP